MIYLIGEIGQAHEGSLGIAHSYIDALAEAGVNAVKFQTHIAEAESSIHEPFRVKFSHEDKTRYDYWKRMEFTAEQWAGLRQHCIDKNLEFISSPFSLAAVDLLEKIGMQKFKIGSGEVSNFLMLQRIAKNGHDIILSSGMSSFQEIDHTIGFLKDFNTNISILQCTTAYPTKPDEWGLNVIDELKKRYNVPVGFSDHSGDIFACLSAATLGAELLEFHAVFDKRMFGPDSKSSLEINEIKQLVKGVRSIEKAMNNPIVKNDNSDFDQLKKIFEKSLSVNKSKCKGEIIEIDDLEAKKPKGYGIPASEFENVINKKLNRDIKRWEFINWGDIN